MARTIGIDLGTTNSVMATIEGGEPTVIPNAEGERLTPSVVAVTPSGERLVGRFARRQAVTNPENTVFSVKRFMGRKYDDPAVQRDKGLVPYQIRGAKNGDVEVKMGDRWYSPQEISARRSPRRLLRCPPTSTTLSVTPQRTPAASPVWTCSASSMSRPLRHWPTVWKTRVTNRSRSMTSAAAPTTSPS